LARGRIARLAVVLPQRGELQRHTQRAELASARVSATTPSCLRRSSAMRVLARAEDLIGEPREHRRRTDLDEGVHARVGHRFDDIHEAHREASCRASRARCSGASDS
jgi:hypothetical protein